MLLASVIAFTSAQFRLQQLDAEPNCTNICMQTTVSPYREDICWERCHNSGKWQLLQLDAEPSCLNVCMQTTFSPFAEDICWNRCNTKELVHQKAKAQLLQLDEENKSKKQCISDCWHDVIWKWYPIPIPDAYCDLKCAFTPDDDLMMLA